MAQDNLLKKLNQIRQDVLPNFAKIKLTDQAVESTSRLFLHPFCINTADLRKINPGKTVKLSTLSQYILTGFPNTICFYAAKRKKTLIKNKDILECFALDHIAGVAENKIALIYSPAYALAHILTLCRVVRIRQRKEYILADLEYQFGEKKIAFHNVFVPPDLEVKKNQNVFHHFGVIIDSERNRDLSRLARTLSQKQKEIEYLCLVTKNTKKIIDFGQRGLYNFDLISYIIKQSKNPEYHYPIKINFDQNKKVPFSK